MISFLSLDNFSLLNPPNTGNRHDRHTCSLTLILVCASELPSTGAGTLIGCVTWFTELGATFVHFQSAQSLVCIMERQRGEGSSIHSRWRVNWQWRLLKTWWYPLPYLFHSGLLWSPTCKHNRSLLRCLSTWPHSCRDCLHTGLHLKTDRKSMTRCNVLLMTVQWWEITLTQHLPTYTDQKISCKRKHA